MTFAHFEEFPGLISDVLSNVRRTGPRSTRWQSNSEQMLWQNRTGWI